MRSYDEPVVRTPLLDLEDEFADLLIDVAHPEPRPGSPLARALERAFRADPGHEAGFQSAIDPPSGPGGAIG